MPRLVGGINASNYTWTVSLRNETNHHFCGGSILNEWYVITAAHCFNGRKEPSKVTICAGTKHSYDQCGQHREIENVIIHPSYRSYVFENDIAMIKLKAHFDFSDISIARICLPNAAHDKEYPKPGTNVTAVGWGENETGHMPDTLQQVTIRVWNGSDDKCTKLVRNSHTIKLCASAPGKGKILLFNRCSISILVF
jgi:secreted trypsin-like serine protease